MERQRSGVKLLCRATFFYIFINEILYNANIYCEYDIAEQEKRFAKLKLSQFLYGMKYSLVVQIFQKQLKL